MHMTYLEERLVCMETELALTRQSQAATVMALLFDDPSLTQEQACAKAGITLRQYRYWLQQGGESIDAVREFITGQQREILADIAVARRTGINMLIKDAVSPMTAGKDRVLILGYLNEVQEELERTHHAVPGIEEEAVAFLKQGPVISTKRSRFASVDIERDEDGVTVRIYKEDEVIDGTLTEPVQADP